MKSINELMYLTATNEANTRAPEFIIGLCGRPE